MNSTWSGIVTAKWVALFIAWMFVLTGFVVVAPSVAGDLTKADIERRFKPPLHVGEKLKDIAAWPLTSELTPQGGPVGYVFESIDLAPIPGFEGTPFNLLIALGADGKFIDVEVLRQHEPVFLGGLGPVPLLEFVKQYANKSLKQEISVSSVYGSTRGGGGGNRVVLDGVAKATASVRIVNQTVLAASLAVARAKLGFADSGSRGPPAVPKAGAFEALDLAALEQRGYLQRVRFTNADIEKLFAGTDGAGADEEALLKPDELFVEFYVAYLNAPIIGRNLLDVSSWNKLKAYLPEGQSAYWVATRGRFGLVDENFVPGTPPPRLVLMQSGLPIELRDSNRDYARTVPLPELKTALILGSPAQAGLDPGQPMEFQFTITRAKGMILPSITHKTVTVGYAAPTALFDFPPRPPPEWLLAWQGRWPDLAIIGTALALLTLVLLRPQWIVMRPRRLLLFRTGFLIFTLVYIGWYAQGQLSIVQITGAIKSVGAGGGLKSFLYDPISLLLIVFTLLTLVVWGRGTFCGWLCPFGALQELVALLARALRIPQWRMPVTLATLLSRSRYMVLALLVGSAAIMPAAAEKLVEVEPFKTSITVGFQREWPFLLWAVGLLVAGLFVYKFFCRFICPLGAALTLGGKLRRWNWLPRIEACGKPCQKCRHACEYDAIARDGAIRYDECFQCLDCVEIYEDPGRCAPKLLYARKGRTVPIRELRLPSGNSR